MFSYILQIVAMGIPLASILIGIDQYVRNSFDTRLSKLNELITKAVSDLTNNDLDSETIQKTAKDLNHMLDDSNELKISDYLHSRIFSFVVVKVGIHISHYFSTIMYFIIVLFCSLKEVFKFDLIKLELILVFTVFILFLQIVVMVRYAFCVSNAEKAIKSRTNKFHTAIKQAKVLETMAKEKISFKKEKMG